MTYSEFAKQYLGVKEGSTKHHYIVDEYNKIRPLPRGYKVKYNDAWCATFVSFVLKKCNAINAPYECGVSDMYSKAKKNGQIVKSPAVNDIIFYDWGHNGTLDHVGIISSISPYNYLVIEGNKNDMVATRLISIKDKSIYGFAHVVQEVTQESTYDQVVTDVIRGKYGNGDDRKRNLAKAGYDYKTIQALVNKRLKGE